MTSPFTQQRLGEILVAKKFVTTEQVEQALEAGARLGEQLIHNGQLTAEQLAEALAEQTSLDYVDLKQFTVSNELFDLIPATLAYQYSVVPVRRENGVLHVAIADPFDLSIVDKMERISGLQVRLLLCSQDAISDTLKRSEGSSAVLKDVSEEFRLDIVKENELGEEQTVSLETIGDDKSPVIKLINTIMLAAIQKRASDVHIETYENGIVVKYRIDGVLYSAMDLLSREHHSAMVSRLKVMAELDIAEKRVPQDGRFKLRLKERNIDFRVSILPSIFGEDVVIRILDKSSLSDEVKNLSLDNLGIGAEALRIFRKSVREPYGMVLITGPTGSGKTTTLYAALSELNTKEEKIITIEDPVEYQLDGIVQIPVNEKKNLTFARGLRSILRHDPDKIMVGEIRDKETVQIAVQSALTGHLVFTTVHANNAFDVIGRFAHMGVDVYSFVTALNCVMAQRLVRMICLKCKQEQRYDSATLEDSGIDPGKYKNHVWYEGAGCDHCGGTGYRGRSAVTEFLDLSPRIREMIVDRRPVSELQAIAAEEGMVTLRQSALAKAIAGETTLKEINRVTFVD